MNEHHDVITRIQKLIDTAIADPAAQSRLEADPWREAHRVGIHRKQTRAALGLAKDADDEQIAAALRARINTPAGFSDNVP